MYEIRRLDRVARVPVGGTPRTVKEEKGNREYGNVRTIPCRIVAQSDAYGSYPEGRRSTITATLVKTASVLSPWTLFALQKGGH